MVAHTVPLERLPAVPCLFRNLTGIPCPFCGLTRGLYAMAAGDWLNTLQTCPVAAILYIGLLAAGICQAVALIRSLLGPRVTE